MKRLRSLFGGTQSANNPVVGDPAPVDDNDRGGNNPSTLPPFHEFTNSTNEVTSGLTENERSAIARGDMILPDPIYVASDEIARRTLDEAGDLQRTIEAGVSPTLPVTREIVARIRGVADFSLRQGGSSTLHTTLIEPGAAWGMGHFGPIFLQEPKSNRGIDARASYDLIFKMYEEYAYLKQTGGRPRPTPEGLVSGLEELGWRRVEEDATVLERWIDVEPWFVQKVMFGGAGHGNIYTYLCPWESPEVPEWAAEAGGVLLGETLALYRRIDDLRAATADQVDTIAIQLAERAAQLTQVHVPLGEHQTRFTDSGFEPSSPEAQVYPAIAQSSLVFGVWGADQSPEACFAELARLNPDILKANVMPTGIGFSDDVQTGWAVVSGPAGSAAFGFELGEGGTQGLIQFGGPDVRPPFQVAMMGFGRTHGEFHAILQGSHIVPIETLPGMALHVPAELAEELLRSGWEVDGDDLYYLRHAGSVVFFLVWTENHFGLCSRARETTRAAEPYELQDFHGQPTLVQLLGRNDPVLDSDRLTAAAQDLIANL